MRPIVLLLGLASASSAIERHSVAPQGDVATQSDARFLTMGEVMLRFAPMDDAAAAAAADETRHQPYPFLRSIGGDELNVAVALRLQGIDARWISVLPTGPLGDVITASCEHYGVEFAGQRVQGADIGTFYVLPEQRTVHYQRRHSAFALHEPDQLDWSQLMEGGQTRPWLHVTGITPLISDSARRSWDRALERAASVSIPVSCDLNHRKQLGTLEQLWAIVAPHVHRFDLLILSLDQLNGLSRIVLGRQAPPPLAVDAPDADFFERMGALQLRWRAKRLVLCRKVRDPSTGVQRRWSVLTSLVADGDDASTVEHFSTYELPVYHTVREELGGGSAFAAGLLLGLHFAPVGEMLGVMRRADLLAALCQQSAGDFSTVSAAELRTAEEEFRGRAALLPPPPPLPSSPAPLPAAARAPADDATGLPGQTNATEGVLDATLRQLRGARVLAILRTQGAAEVAIRRGVELVGLGCRAIEVTLDSPHWPAILAGLRAQLPPEVPIGVGTVMDETVGHLSIAASLGASFALSPIDPTGFVDECHRLGLLAVPSAFTSNEMWALHRRGVKLIKLFHAGLASPSILKSMLGVGPLGTLSIMPSGGVSPANAREWLDAGAAVVGMGSNLVGKLTVPQWDKKAKAAAAKLFANV